MEECLGVESLILVEFDQLLGEQLQGRDIFKRVKLLFAINTKRIRTKKIPNRMG